MTSNFHARLAKIESSVNVQNDLASLSDEELEAKILDTLTDWCRQGHSLETIAESLREIGYHDTGDGIAAEYSWDPETQRVISTPTSPSARSGLRTAR